MLTWNCVRIVSVNVLNAEFELGALLPNVVHINNENDSVLHGPLSQFPSFILKASFNDSLGCLWFFFVSYCYFFSMEKILISFDRVKT